MFEIFKTGNRNIFWVALSAAISLTGYKLLRSVTDSLFLEEFGSKNLPYVMTLVPVGVAISMLMYSWVLKNVGPRKTLLISIVVSGFLFFVFFGLIRIRVPYATAVLYILKWDPLESTCRHASLSIL